MIMINVINKVKKKIRQHVFDYAVTAPETTPLLSLSATSSTLVKFIEKSSHLIVERRKKFKH